MVTLNKKEGNRQARKKAGIEFAVLPAMDANLYSIVEALVFSEVLPGPEGIQVLFFFLTSCWIILN